MLRRLVLLSLLFAHADAVKAQEKSAVFPGRTKTGFLLPNGWTISPAGKHVIVSDLPLNIIAQTDNRHALVASSGYNKHELCLVDLDSLSVVSRVAVGASWYGLASLPGVGSSRIWWS